jgi:hypothetical protein
MWARRMPRGGPCILRFLLLRQIRGLCRASGAELRQRDIGDGTLRRQPGARAGRDVAILTWVAPDFALLSFQPVA